MTIAATVTEAMWDLLRDWVDQQQSGEKVLASEVHADLMDFLETQGIKLPAVFQGNVRFEAFDMFVDGGAIFLTNTYPDEPAPDQKHTFPIFIECGEGIDSKILEAFPALADHFVRAYCPDSVQVEHAADAAEVETESAPGPHPDDGLWQHVDMATTDGAGTASGWIPKRYAVENGSIDFGDERDWRVTVAYEGFVLNAEQMKLLPPTGYISDTRH
jgi:hypothetical protein